MLPSRPTTRVAPSVLFTLIAAICGGNAVGATPAPGDLAGAWKSACVDPGNGQGIVLSFTLADATWALDYSTFGDAACAAPFLTVHIEGPYTLGAMSTAVPGAREGEFHFGTKTVTPHVEAAVGFLAGACGGSFTIGQSTDIAAGCPGLGAYPIATCPIDHDIVQRDGDTLQFGARPADNNMCSADRRPTAPGLPLIRQ